MKITEYLKDHILYLDGGMGTLLQARGLQPGELPERWNLLHPETVRDIHRAYYDAGSNVVSANTFGANCLKFAPEELDAIVGEEVVLWNDMTLASDDEERYSIASRLTDVDIRFHSKLFEMTGNKSLIDFQYILRHLFTLYYPKIRNDYHSQTLVSHVSLFNILRTGTADAFRMGMRLHLKTQFDNMETILDKTFRNK